MLVRTCLLVILASSVVGCDGNIGEIGDVDRVWGRRGPFDGQFLKPRAMAIDLADRIYVVDMTARIQVFDCQGHFLVGWHTPDHSVGKPSGLSIGIDGNLLVADTHYYQVLIYSPQGRLLRTIGGEMGHQPGQFGLITDAVQDSRGNYYIAEYGEYDRIQKLSPDGEFILEWGGHGDQPGQFARPQNLAVDENDHIWVADACNHRIQVFDTRGNLLRCWGTQGGAPGELYYPYDLILAPDSTVYISEFGNHRVQKFTREGRTLGCWGTHGRGPGQLHHPWALVRDSRQKIHVLDTNNHRIQTVRM